MTEERLSQLIDSYGADPARWPADERGAASELATRLRGDTARTSFAAKLSERTSAAEQLDTVLARLPQPEMSPTQQADVMQRLTAHAQNPAQQAQTNPSWLDPAIDWLTNISQPGALWRPAAVATLPLALGFALGLQTTLQASSLDEELSLDVSLYAFEAGAVGDELYGRGCRVDY